MDRREGRIRFVGIFTHYRTRAERILRHELRSELFTAVQRHRRQVGALQELTSGEQRLIHLLTQATWGAIADERGLPIEEPATLNSAPCDEVDTDGGQR